MLLAHKLVSQWQSFKRLGLQLNFVKETLQKEILKLIGYYISRVCRGGTYKIKTCTYLSLSLSLSIYTLIL